MSKYEQRGVSADKLEVYAAIKNLDKGLYPNAFCKILPDLVGGHDHWCNIMHADTAGTKTGLAYLYWRETRDIGVWAGIVQDAIVMNLDDMACVGCTNDFVLSSTIGRNKRLIPGEVLTVLIESVRLFCESMLQLGVRIHLAGGETADVGDIVRTADVGFTAFARMQRAHVIEANIQPQAFIVGVSSAGQAVYESSYNSGIGSNGLTSARHDVLSSYYKLHYPEAYDTAMPDDLAFTGSKRLTDQVFFGGQVYSVGQLLLSPTRTYLPLLNRVIPALRSDIQGIIHNTGGGLTKVMKFLPAGVTAVKDNLLPVPPVFELIAAESQTPAEEMYRVFNMGCRLELYVRTESAAQFVLEHCAALGLDAQIIGRTVASEGAGRVQVTAADGTTFVYV